MKDFKTKDELLEVLKELGACEEGMDFVNSQSTLDDILKNCNLDYRLWGLGEGLTQFAEHCDWSKLDGVDWSELLIVQPQLKKYRKAS